MGLYLILFPFGLAMVMGLLAPELSGAVRNRVVTLMREASNRMQRGGKIPPHASPEYVGDYIEYAADVAQAIPSLLLPVVGTAMLLKGDSLQVSSTLILLLVVPGSLFIFLRMLKADPVSYVAHKYVRARYTFLPLAGIVLNAGCIVFILTIHLLGLT